MSNRGMLDDRRNPIAPCLLFARWPIPRTMIQEHDNHRGGGQMPQVFRIMRRDADGLPTLQQSSSALGVRPNVDISLDAQGLCHREWGRDVR